MITQLYPKYFTVKQWSKFNYAKQQVLCRKYDVILTDHTTKREKLLGILSKININNLNKGIDKFTDGLDEFSKVTKEMNSGLGKKDYSGLMGKQPDYKRLTG